jgi:hypothetical protein
MQILLVKGVNSDMKEVCVPMGKWKKVYFKTLTVLPINISMYLSYALPSELKI